jgi:hypothetical protein
VLDYIDSACRAWGRSTRWILTDTGEGFPTADTIERARQGMLSAKDRTPSQHFPEVRLGDALAIANAMRAPPAMPIALQAVLWAHYVARCRSSERARTLGLYLGRRGPTGLSMPEYWRWLDRAHWWLASRIVSQRADA